MDIRTGSGELSADEGRTVHFLWSLRQGNGYFVGSSNSADNEEIIYKVGNTKGTKVIAGLDEGIRGMKAGGIRRIDVPPKKGYTQGVAEGNPGPIPAGFGPRRQILTHAQRDTFHFEVKLTKIK
jgi:FKBP-type peptidyl-prolyl cis-trans isomerase